MEWGELTAIALYFFIMIVIGVYVYYTAEQNVSGYLLGGRHLGPAVTALSAGASDMSGWMLMGLPGAVYLLGLSPIWMGIGLVLGAYLNYLWVAPRLRVYTEIAGDACTLPDYFEKRFSDSSHLLRILASIVIIIFFTLYTSSGVVSGGKLFDSAFGWSYHSGVIVITAIVVTYTLFGGFLAVSLTDFVQGCLMLLALLIVPIAVHESFAGKQSAISILNSAHLNLLSWTSGTTALGIISTMAWGLGYFGQPHILVRFMAIRSIKDLPVARRIGIGWMVLSLIGAVLTGLFGRAYMVAHGQTLADSETIFIVLANILFNPFITGFLLAAVLAAIMSTISSQLLVTSSSLISDLYCILKKERPPERQIVLLSRIAVIVVALVASLLALNPNNSILALVSHAWAGFGAAFGPMIICSLYLRSMTLSGAIAGIVVGAGMVLFWVYAPISINGHSLGDLIYAIVPGFIASFLAIIVVSQLTKKDQPDIIRSFNEMKRIVAS